MQQLQQQIFDERAKALDEKQSLYETVKHLETRINALELVTVSIQLGQENRKQDAEISTKLRKIRKKRKETANTSSATTCLVVPIEQSENKEVKFEMVILSPSNIFETSIDVN